MDNASLDLFVVDFCCSAITELLLELDVVEEELLVLLFEENPDGCNDTDLAN